jgi:hypothetical protein
VPNRKTRSNLFDFATPKRTSRARACVRRSKRRLTDYDALRHYNGGLQASHKGTKVRTNHEAEELLTLQPDPLEPSAEETERYVGALQKLTESDPELARHQTWNQLRLAGMRARRHRDEVQDSLNLIFRLGALPEPGPNGRFDGLAITPTTFAFCDPVLSMLSSLWMPWLGKRFDAERATGENIMPPGARLPSKLLWPSHRSRSLEDGRFAAFPFRTYAGAGAIDTDRRVLKIDYDCAQNPGFLIRSILDELVLVVPGVYLGKALLRRNGPPKPNWRPVGYFALRPAAPGDAGTPLDPRPSTRGSEPMAR